MFFLLLFAVLSWREPDVEAGGGSWIFPNKTEVCRIPAARWCGAAPFPLFGRGGKRVERLRRRCVWRCRSWPAVVARASGIAACSLCRRRVLFKAGVLSSLSVCSGAPLCLWSPWWRDIGGDLGAGVSPGVEDLKIGAFLRRLIGSSICHPARLLG
jgi:hypothetical protein